MFVLGHLGIGSQIARPFAKGLALRWVLAGTLLPDLLDKPLYYALSWSTGKVGAELGLVSCTRTFGHTGLFLIALTVLFLATRSRVIAAIALGAATHLLLDNVGDRILGSLPSSAYQALIFPLGGLEFAMMPTSTLGEHLHSTLNPYTIITESLGFLLLTWTYWKQGKTREIRNAIRARVHQHWQRLRRLRRRGLYEEDLE